MSRLRVGHKHKYLIAGYVIGEWTVLDAYGVCRCGAMRRVRLA